MLSTLYKVEINTINYHIKKIYNDSELNEESTIRNFRIVQKEEKGIQVRFKDGDLWLTQKAIADLFTTSKQDVSYHSKNIFNTFGLGENSAVKNI